MVQADVMQQRAGITYRQLDTWTTKGHLRVDKPRPGTGRVREWPHAEIEVAQRIKKLLAAGFTLPVAAELARRVTGEVKLADGVIVILDL